LVATNLFAPFTSVMTAITDATPMTTPSSVRMERNLFDHNDFSDIFTASRKFITHLHGLKMSEILDAEV